MVLCNAAAPSHGHASQAASLIRNYLVMQFGFLRI